ncbi:hypothetical protein [Tropicibacter oceani]|uniref:Uncharacterized protein n=1 Tax=Tropicibacter oceani TaxID=3058420 RepID=A0ABY8QKY9_9RHOB|nr:hypothetical protein [Tropicibacter oceani]WGW04482.1 hypothetical protein QF118_02735 [Tropicibacter oceani]
MIWALRILAALALAAAALSWAANRQPLERDTIAMLTDRLMEFGAVDFVHDGYLGPEAALFACVTAGQTLNTEQSARYRIAYQGFLLDKQRLFSALDADLQLRQDQGMTLPNNVGGQGIAGLHDHHDASARANLEDIAQSLVRLETAAFTTRTLLANDIYKDLTDLMVHMAPAVHSVGLIPPDPMPQDLPDTLSGPFARFYAGMKAAQGMAVNSAGYWSALDDAQSGYADLIAAVQSRLRARNGSLLHMMSGNWLSLQTVAPVLGVDSPSTQRRRQGGPCRSG